MRPSGNKDGWLPSASVPTTDERVDEILAELRRDGGRVTATRRRVVEVIVASRDHHLTAADIVGAVRADEPEFYESTVYRTLDRLVELRLVQRVQLGPGPAVYHLAHRPHEHLVCERCGGVTEIDAGLVDALAEQVLVTHGFHIRSAASTIAGICRSCAE